MAYTSPTQWVNHMKSNFWPGSHRNHGPRKRRASHRCLKFRPTGSHRCLWVSSPQDTERKSGCWIRMAEFCKTAISNISLGLNETATASDTWSLTRYHITKLGWSVKCPWLNTQLSTHLTAEYAPFFPGHPDSITPTIAKPHVTHVDFSKLLQIWGFNHQSHPPQGITGKTASWCSEPSRNREGCVWWIITGVKSETAICQTDNHYWLHIPYHVLSMSIVSPCYPLVI